MGILDKILEDRGTTPNSFTLGMGRLIRLAREELGISQAELSRQIFKRQASLSDMENGKMQPDAETLLMIALVLKKPLAYFIPSPYGEYFGLEKLSVLEQELLLQAKRLEEDDLKRVIAQVRALVLLYEGNG